MLLAKRAVLAMAEIKTAAEAFDRGEPNVFDALDAVMMAVEGYAEREAGTREAAGTGYCQDAGAELAGARNAFVARAQPELRMRTELRTTGAIMRTGKMVARRGRVPADATKTPRVGLEPTTYRLTAGRSTIELSGIVGRTRLRE